MWFTYGDVNGVDYWNLQAGRRIAHRSAEAKGDRLKIESDWIDPNGVTVFNEERKVIFGGGDDVLWMDHDITLTAQTDVMIGDSKEGAFGLRVADSLREQDRTGRYINADSLETARNVWGKPSPWVALSGEVASEAGVEPVTVAIFAHHETVNFPPYWHARDYGLFTANPFGRHEYDKSKPERVLQLKKGDTVRVHMALAVYHGKVEKARLDADYQEYQK